MPTPFDRLDRARDLLEAGRWAKAQRLLQAPVPTALMSERDFLLAEALRLQGFFRKARPLYESAVHRASRESDRELAVEAMLGLVRIARSLGETESAWPRLRTAWRLAPPEQRDALLLEQALLDRAEERYDVALKALTKLLATFRQEGDRAAVGYALWATGGARRFSGDLPGAVRDFKASLAASKAAKDKEGMGYALFGLAGASRIAGDAAGSLKWYKQAAECFRKTDDVFGRAYAFCGTANAQRQLGLWDEARANYERSYKLYSSIEDWADLAYVDWGLGRLLLQKGKLKQAQARFSAARAAFAKFNETRGVVLSELSLASVLHCLGRSGEAEALHEAAVERAQRAGIHTHLEIFT
jgi:tetratricopeptide (TPR) repeat protein